MLMDEYECEECGKKIKVEDEEKPDCCGKPMKKISLDVCTQPAHAEHTRTIDSDEPCDDGRAG